MAAARPLVLLLSCAALLGACGGDDAGAPAAQATTTADATGRGGPGVTVGIEDFRFQPATIRISVGEPVTWRNDGATGHTVVGRGVADPPESGEVKPGGTYTWRARRAGTMDYLCTVHPNMTGRVIVEG